MKNMKGFSLLEVTVSLGIAVGTFYISSMMLAQTSRQSGDAMNTLMIAKIGKQISNDLGFSNRCAALLNPFFSKIQTSLAKNKNASLVSYSSGADDAVLNDFVNLILPKNPLVQQNNQATLKTEVKSLVIDSIDFKIPTGGYDQVGQTLRADMVIKLSYRNADGTLTSLPKVISPLFFRSFSTSVTTINCQNTESPVYMAASDMCSAIGGSMQNGQCMFTRFVRSRDPASISASTNLVPSTSDQFISVEDTLCYLDNLSIRTLMVQDSPTPTYPIDRRTFYCADTSAVKANVVYNSSAQLSASAPKNPAQDDINNVSKSVQRYFPYLDSGGFVKGQ